MIESEEKIFSKFFETNENISKYPNSSNHKWKQFVLQKLDRTSDKNQKHEKRTTYEREKRKRRISISILANLSRIFIPN